MSVAVRAELETRGRAQMSTQGREREKKKVTEERRKDDVCGRKEERHPKRKFRELTECETIGVNVRESDDES